MNVADQKPMPIPSEARPLAQEMARHYRTTVEAYRQLYHLSAPEACARADRPVSQETIDLIQSRPADDVSWRDLGVLADWDPTLSLRRWEDMKKAALVNLQTGHRAATLLEGLDSIPWGRAQFAAIYQELVEGWQPRNGIERQLIEMMATAMASMHFWQGQLTHRITFDAKNERRDVRESGGWAPPRVSDKEAEEQAAQMYDRQNKLYLRTLRALRDLRRYAPTVIVQNGGQINVGGQQVNVASVGP
jgi:hypothetical protein